MVKRRLDRGITLGEVLVVMVIVGLLAAFVLPGLERSHEMTRRVQCTNKLKEIGSPRSGMLAGFFVE